MRKRTWQKIAALFACAAMIITTPDISNLVNVSGSSYEDETTGVEFISNEAEDVEAVSEDEGGFSGTEISDEDQTTNTDFSASDADTDTAEFVSDFSSGTDEVTDSAMITDTETEVQPAAAVILESADAPQASAAAQGQPRWVHITSNASSTRQGKARIRLYMTDAQDDSPAYILYTSLFSQWQETVPEQEPSSGAVTLPPTKLEGALNGTDVLSVSRVQEYQKDDNGEYVLDANGNLITTACYLEYELAAGSSADFYAAFVYKTQEESYSYKADLKAKVTWEEEEQSQDVTLPEDTGKITLTWDSSAVTSGDTISADPEVPDNQEDETSGEGSQEQPSLVRISMTKTLEAGCQDVADVASDTEAEDVSDENTDSADENTENTSAEAEIALSGQLYGVHVTAQDLHTDATADSTIKLDLKDMGSGLPVSGLFVSMGKTEEEALSSEASDSSVIPNGLTDGDLTVTRVQNDSEDYLTFQLPAGDTADFYVGISYHAQEETYNKTIGIEPEALQETSLQDVDAQQEADPQNIEEQQSAANAELDVLSALPGAIPVESETAAVQDATSQDPESQEDTEGATGEDAGKQLISVLESGAAAITLAWAARSSAGTVYFAVPADWINNGYTVKAWLKAGKSNDDPQSLIDMTDTNGRLYKGLQVYSIPVTSDINKYGGLEELYFQAFQGGTNKDQKVAITGWAYESVFLDKLYDSEAEQWVDYSSFDPDDHTSFKGKTMYFENKTDQTLTGVNAVFYEKNNGEFQQVTSVEMTGNANGKANGYSVTIPDAACSYVQFTDASGKVLGDTYSNFYGQGTGETGVESVLFAEGSTDCYKYAGTPENSTWGVLGSRTVYFDATYSKLSYKKSASDDAAYSIPAEDGTFKYYISGDGKDDISGNMTPVSSHSENGHTWKDVYKAELPEGYTKIAFFGFAPANATNFGAHGESTNTLTIPTNLVNPCFYADAGDTVVYDGGQRDGYWDEVYTIRNAEAKKSSKDVVDIAQDTFTRASDTLYVNSTFYDYYTDYELNGNNRDKYPGANGTSYRNWVTYREFDQALSDYYQANGSSIPLYVGHFQPSYSDWGYQFSGIASTLNLYGYDNYNNFFSTNNSALDINGNNNGSYARIAKGLVNGTLANGNLVTTKEGNAVLPLFNEDFLLGNNSKNAVIGDVYHNVAFPFKQEDLKDDGVKYWVFNSHDTTLLMKQDETTGEYHLQNPGSLSDKCKNLNSSSAPQAKHGFFPFNETSTSGSANTYNYGFGAKLEFNFRLTKDGTVKNNKDEAVPIEFNFSGDDDVWVFIDGKLALDVGGAHGPAKGTLNFATLEATVSDVKASAGDGSPTTVTKFTLEGDKTAEHTLTMFYMERGMWESNMKVTFNFPDENQLQVEKQVDTEGVNSLFSDLFKDSSIFNFSIKNLATHYGERKVTSGAAKPLRIAEQSYTVAPIHKDNIFAKVDSGDSNLTGSVHWYAKEDDADSSYREQRYGELTLGNPVDISKMAYLEIKFYYDYTDTPSLSNMYLQFEDSSGKIGGNLRTDTLSGRTYGAVSMKSKEWVTVKLDLSKMSWDEGFDKTKLSKLRFGYNYPRNFYLKDFVFRPTVEISEPTGFVTKQYEIPDYGSATSGKLEIPEGATYTSTSTKRDARVIGDDGEFVLEDHETITFKDQFRRGSYIALKEEVDPDLFDTTWTMYENGQVVAGMGTGTTVTNASSIPSMTNHTGTAIDDGRTEAKLTGNDADGQKQDNAYNGTKPTESTFVFRSYANPDNTTTATKLKAVFYNKVKTGTLKIIKTAAYGEQLSGEYKFRVTFSNVGDLGLEDTPITQEYTIKLNGDGQPGSCEITGIPVGTFLKVEEISTDDGSTLDSIMIDGIEQPKGTTAAKGYIKSSGTTVETTFRNTKKPVVNISVEKLWKNADESVYTGKLPKKIYVQLQRRQSNTDTWASADENPKAYTELAGNMYTGKWQTSFTGLDKYVDYKSNPQIEWQYRVVEVSVGTDGSVTPIDESGNTIQLSEGRFAVTYDKDKITGEEIITNTYQLPKTRIQILKIQAGTSGSDVVKLKGAKFRLEKMTADGSSFTPIEATTAATPEESLGLAAFEDLEDGTYQITEIQAPEGYSLLASPIKVVLNRKGNSILVDNQDVSGKLQGDTITIQVADQKKFNLPATGSWSRLILGFSGGILIGLAVIIYLLQKRRKEGKAS